MHGHLSNYYGILGQQSLSQFVGDVPANFNFVASPQNFTTGIDPYDGVSPAWSFNQASATANVAMAPDKTFTGSHLTEDNTSNVHNIQPFQIGHFAIESLPYATQHRVAFIAKAAERTRCVAQLQMYSGPAGPQNFVSVGFDLAGGNTNYSNVVQAGWTLLAANMVSLPGGWFLCTVDLDVWGGNSSFLFLVPRIFIDNGSGTAAQSTSYAGNGASGIYLWWFNLLPLGAWAINQLAFFDDFNTISTIDMADTGNPGFNWYLRGQWLNNTTIQNGMNFFGTGIVPNTYPASNLSVSNSVLTDVGGVAARSGVHITTACPAANAAGYVGNVFGFPGVFEGKASWDDTAVPGNFTIEVQTLCWGSAIEMLVGNPAALVFRELDGVEDGGPGPGTTLHQETITKSPPGAPGVSDIFQAFRSSILPFPDTRPMTRYASMVITLDINGGTYSLLLLFADGLYINNSMMNWGPTVVPSNVAAPVGTFAAQDTQHIPLILSGGSLSPTGVAPFIQWPIHVDWVKVWQRTSAPSNPHLFSPSVTPSTISAAIAVITDTGNGILYWVVTLSAVAPTAVQIKAGQDNASSPATSSGNQAITLFGGQSATAAGLTIGTHYTAFFYQENAALVASNIVSDSFATTGAPPVLSAQSVTPLSTSASLSVSTDNGTGTLWWVVTLSSTQPTAAQIKAGQDHLGSAATSSGNQAVSATGAQVSTATGLTTSTTYTAFWYQESNVPVGSNIVSSTFTTQSTTFATWDPATKSASITLSGANLIATAGGVLCGARSTIGKSSGKYYWEITITADSSGSSFIGLTDSGFNNATFPGNYANSISAQFGGGVFHVGWSSGSGQTPAFGVGDVVMFAVDFTAGSLWWGKNGAWAGNSPSGAAAWTLTGGGGVTLYAVTDPYTATHTANFGASAFAFSVPAGYNAGLF